MALEHYRKVKWIETNWFPTLKAAEEHVNRTLPTQSTERCCVRDDGFSCTLLRGHSHDHEAWGGSVMYHSWPNMQQVREQ